MTGNKVGDDCLGRKVGYKNPPKHTQFKKGTSGNPKGRPKKAALGIKAIYRKVFGRVITATVSGRATHVSALEAIMLQVLTSALKGDHRATKLALDLGKVINYTEENAGSPQLEALFAALMSGPVGAERGEISQE
jgi:hypothetical protein